MAFGEKPSDDVLSVLNTHEDKSLFSYFRSSKKNDLNTITMKNQLKEIVRNEIKKDNTIIRRESISKLKTFTPSSDQIKQFKLKEGRNEISFVCRSRLSGKQLLTSEIYLWEHSDKIIISDVDGTITRSDVLGHLMPMIGKDWSHEGVTELFTNIDKRGYKFLYLTARAICQSSTTKDYLNNLFQSNMY